MLFWGTTVVYYIHVWGRQVWLGIVHTACLLDGIYTVKIDRFTKSDRDRLTDLESIFTIYVMNDVLYRVVGYICHTADSIQHKSDG